MEGRGNSEDIRASKINSKFLILHSHEFMYKKVWGSVRKQSDLKRHSTSGLALAYYFFHMRTLRLGEELWFAQTCLPTELGLEHELLAFQTCASVMMWLSLAWLCVSSDPNFTLILVTLELVTVRMLACCFSLVLISTHISI